MAHDPAVTKAAIEALRRELRSRTGGKVTAPSPDEDEHAPMLMGEDNPDEGSPEEEAHESPEEEKSEGDVKCPECGAVFSSHEGEPPVEEDGKKKELLILMPEGKK